MFRVNGTTKGLSPRVRGNRGHFADDVGWWRSIPACAGEPNYYKMPLAVIGVYPRVCGGTLVFPVGRYRAWGLSPRVRGNHMGMTREQWGERSIPACAGEPMQGVSQRKCVAVYPRVCGGTNGNIDIMVSGVGLSPRVRGNLDGYDSHRTKRRSIPACAGEPRSILPVSAAAPVYPRVCGGTIVGGPTLPSDEGLSPRVRGNLGICRSRRQT